MKDRSTPHLRYLNKIPARPVLPFLQELQLVQGDDVLASARWYAPASDDGIVQILDIHVAPPHQRIGHGSTLIRAIYDQAHALFDHLQLKPRRIWLSVEQKHQINARAFLSRHGFHHVSTIANLYRGQDALVYQRSFD